MKLWIAPRLGAKRNIDIVRRFQEYTNVFDGMTTGTALEQLKMFQDNGWFTESECFLTVAFHCE